MRGGAVAQLRGDVDSNVGVLTTFDSGAVCQQVRSVLSRAPSTLRSVEAIDPRDTLVPAYGYRRVRGTRLVPCDRVRVDIVPLDPPAPSAVLDRRNLVAARGWLPLRRGRVFRNAVFGSGYMLVSEVRTHFLETVYLRVQRVTIRAYEILVTAKLSTLPLTQYLSVSTPHRVLWHQFAEGGS